MLETRQVLKKVKKIEIKTRNLVEGLLQGAYHSVFKGRGIEFSEVREYMVGDDVRTIDWNVTARMNKPFVKEFIEERDLTIVFAFDVSGSSYFGSTKEKKEHAIELIASLMFAALKNNDNTALCMFTDNVEKFIPARKGKRHVLRMIRELIYFKPAERKTDVASCLRFLSRVVKKRSIIFVISDFFGKPFSKELKLLRNRHDVIAVTLYDPRELEMPDVGMIELEDEETGEQVLVDTSDPSFRENYVKIVNKNLSAIRRNFSKLKVDCVDIRTDTNFESPLRKFFKLRQRRLR